MGTGRKFVTLQYLHNSLDPRPSSPPDLRPSGRHGRGPGKTAILFGELRATSSIFSRFRKVSLVGRGAQSRSLLKVITDFSCCKLELRLARVSSCLRDRCGRPLWCVVCLFCFVSRRPGLSSRETEKDYLILHGKSFLQH